MRHLRRKRRERGAALILIALSLTATVSVAGIVIDGGNAFAQRRQMQNAADSAALAGARALSSLTSAGDSTTIWTAVKNAATSNGVSVATVDSMVQCSLTDDHAVVLYSCPKTTPPTPTAATVKLVVSGVAVTVAATSATSFMRIAGIQTFTARARATAQVEALRFGSSPFMICAVGTLTDPIRSAANGQVVPIILPGNIINSSDVSVSFSVGGISTHGAVNQVYDLQNPGNPDCGLQGNNFKGNAGGTGNFPIPGDWPYTNGSLGSNVFRDIVDGPNAGCTSANFENCVVAVPLCYGPPTSVNGTEFLHCIAYGAFRLHKINASRIQGTFLRGVIPAGGQGGGHAQDGQLSVIKLTS